MERNTELLLRVARMYHVQSETMDAIAHHLGVSRSTVSRLLKEARDRGLVRVTITDPDRPMTRLAEIFRRSFHVQAHLVNVRPGSSYVLRLEQVAKVAARLLDEIITDDDVVGVAWGTTVSVIAQHLRPRDLSGVIVVSLNGGANQRTTGLPYVGSILQRFAAAFHGEEQFLALPAFFDNPDTRTESSWAHEVRISLAAWSISRLRELMALGRLRVRVATPSSRVVTSRSVMRTAYEVHEAHPNRKREPTARSS